jgi:meiosis-specific protein
MTHRLPSIVEAYTFNVHVCEFSCLSLPIRILTSCIQYHHLPGTDTVIPILSLGDDLMKMSLGGPRKNADPAAEASKKGKAPTLGEVQKSLKARIKPCIMSLMRLY